MEPVVVVSRVGKMFRRHRGRRPSTIQEAVAKGLRSLGDGGWFWGLRDVSFNLAPGRTLGIVGANGSGKSTLLRLIGGVGRPDTGRIDVGGRLGALLDLNAGFHPDLTGRENAILAGILNGLTRRQTLERLDPIVAFAEMEEVLDDPIRTYSSGMQMRLAFSVAVHTEPEVLLIDEVLAVGDERFRQKCQGKIADIRRSGCAIAFVSHDLATVAALSDDVLWLDAGRLVAEGTPADVLGRYATFSGEAPQPVAPQARTTGPASNQVSPSGV